MKKQEEEEVIGATAPVNCSTPPDFPLQFPFERFNLLKIAKKITYIGKS